MAAPLRTRRQSNQQVEGRVDRAWPSDPAAAPRIRSNAVAVGGERALDLVEGDRARPGGPRNRSVARLVGPQDERHEDARGRAPGDVDRERALGERPGAMIVVEQRASSARRRSRRNFSRTMALSSDSQTSRSASMRSVRSPFQRASAAKRPSSFSGAGEVRIVRRPAASSADGRVDHPLDDGLEEGRPSSRSSGRRRPSRRRARRGRPGCSSARSPSPGSGAGRRRRTPRGVRRGRRG